MHVRFSLIKAGSQPIQLIRYSGPTVKQTPTGAKGDTCSDRARLNVSVSGTGDCLKNVLKTRAISLHFPHGK